MSEGQDDMAGRLTHFLCIPLVNEHTRPQLVASMGKLRTVVEAHNHSHDDRARRERPRPPRLPLEAIRPVGSLHLTLGVMSLADPSKMRQAHEFLHGPEVAGILQQITRVDHAPIVCALRSLHAMGSPSKTPVLYIHPDDPTDRLLPLCQALNRLFITAGLVVSQNRPLKLHATVFNTRYVPVPPPTKRWGPPQPQPQVQVQVDARELIGQLKDEVWAESVVLDRLAICRMGASKLRDDANRVIDEVYEEVSSVSF